jgi:RNA polymerase sigma-70 factor (ECF subfamily)
MKRTSTPRAEIAKSGRPSDAELFREIAAGELGPLGVLFDRYHEDVRQFVLRSARAGADVDDVAQETFLTAARAASSYDGRESARPFLIGVAAQLLRRRRRTFARLDTLLEAFGRAPRPRPPTPEDAVATNEEERRLHAAMAKLSDERRMVLVMVEWNGMSGVEVAEALGIPPGTVWRRLHEARATLKTVIEGGGQ